MIIRFLSHREAFSSNISEADFLKYFKLGATFIKRHLQLKWFIAVTSQCLALISADKNGKGHT